MSCSANRRVVLSRDAAGFRPFRGDRVPSIPGSWANGAFGTGSLRGTGIGVGRAFIFQSRGFGTRLRRRHSVEAHRGSRTDTEISFYPPPTHLVVIAEIVN